jgi:hypothetical protein
VDVHNWTSSVYSAMNKPSSPGVARRFKQDSISDAEEGEFMEEDVREGGREGGREGRGKKGNGSGQASMPLD